MFLSDSWFTLVFISVAECFLVLRSVSCFFSVAECCGVPRNDEQCFCLFVNVLSFSECC